MNILREFLKPFQRFQPSNSSNSPTLPPPYTIHRLATWHDFKSFVDELPDSWAFRGQGDSRWELETSMERTDFVSLSPSIEREFVAEFQRGARNYLSQDTTPEHLIEWLALMQHHGAPTRLLDFSRSPYVAAFFAFEACYAWPDSCVSIWCLNTEVLNRNAIEALGAHFADDLNGNRTLVDGALFQKIFAHDGVQLVFPVEPFRMNRRYSLQQSIFVSTGNPREPFMQQLLFLKDALCEALIKVELPAELSKPVLRDLQRMNLNRASLFPDLDGYAHSLRLRYNSLPGTDSPYPLGGELR